MKIKKTIKTIFIFLGIAFLTLLLMLIVVTYDFPNSYYLSNAQKVINDKNIPIKKIVTAEKQVDEFSETLLGKFIFIPNEELMNDNTFVLESNNYMYQFAIEMCNNNNSMDWIDITFKMSGYYSLEQKLKTSCRQFR